MSALNASGRVVRNLDLGIASNTVKAHHFNVRLVAGHRARLRCRSGMRARASDFGRRSWSCRNGMLVPHRTYGPIELFFNARPSDVQSGSTTLGARDDEAARREGRLKGPG